MTTEVAHPEEIVMPVVREGYQLEAFHAVLGPLNPEEYFRAEAIFVGWTIEHVPPHVFRGALTRIIKEINRKRREAAR